MSAKPTPRTLGVVAVSVSLAALVAGALCVGHPFALERSSGWLALVLAIATLTATPLARLLRSRPAIAIAVQRARRPLGLSTAALALLHGLLSLFRYLGDDALTHLPVLFTLPWLSQGALALSIFLLLAITSLRPVARRTRAWTALHRLAYVAALLGASHALLGPHADRAPLIAIVILLLLLAARLIPRRVIVSRDERRV